MASIVDHENSFPITSRSRLRRYAVAIGLAGIAWAAREMTRSLFTEETPFVLFLSAVMAAGWYGGFAPGFLTAVLCALIVDYYFQQPFYTLSASPDQLNRILFFLLESVVTCALCGQLHAARQRAERSAAESRKLERMVERIAEAEQRRIGQDLHDGLGQHLTGVAFLSKALQQRLLTENRREATEAATINQLVNESIRWTRDLARGLAPMDLDRTSLPESLKDLARKTSWMFNVECTYDGVENVELADDETALNLYRVAQEAVSNGVKHGKARRVTIDLNHETGVVLTIHDDGVGFDPVAVAASNVNKGMGLQVMRYRAGVIGGRLELVSSAGSGTEVRCRLNLPHGDGGASGVRARLWPRAASPQRTTPSFSTGIQTLSQEPTQ